jgi:hypothetical protein
MNERMTALHANSFCVLHVTTRDSAKTIVEAAEERSLLVDPELCQKARSELINPRTRLSAEVGWMPGVAPHVAEELVQSLGRLSSECPEPKIPNLAKANVIAAAFGLSGDNEPPQQIAEKIGDFCSLVDSISAQEVMRDINEDRAIAGFPEIQSLDPVEAALSERRKEYRAVLLNLLDRMQSDKLIEAITAAVEIATDSGRRQGSAFLDDLVDSYEVETQGFLQKEGDNIAALIESARNAAPRGEKFVEKILDKLDPVVKNWDRVAQPIQLSAKARGILHRQSHDIAVELRSLSVDLNNDFNMLNQTQKMTVLLQEVFAEVPEVAERLDADSETIQDLRRQADERERNNAEWANSITFSGDVGFFFKQQLSISPDGVSWNGVRYPLNAISRVRWGGVRRSVNGVSTGADYTIAFGDKQSEQNVQLRNESIFNGFISALWRGVCVRLMIEMLHALADGKTFEFGDMTVGDDTVVLFRRKIIGADEAVSLKWSEVHVWSADGSFYIGHQTDKKVYGFSSYIQDANTHILEHAIRGGFKKGIRRLSDFLKD